MEMRNLIRPFDHDVFLFLLFSLVLKKEVELVISKFSVFYLIRADKFLISGKTQKKRNKNCVVAPLICFLVAIEVKH